VLKVKSNINSNSNINISQPKLFTQTVYYFIKRSKLSHFSLPVKPPSGKRELRELRAPVNKKRNCWAAAAAELMLL